MVEEEEVKATEEVQSKETPLVEESQDQASERQEEDDDDEEEVGDERGPPQSQHALQPPESPKETAPSRPTSLPTVRSQRVTHQQHQQLPSRLLSI